MWSTRQVAELAGTTVRTVRHYHDAGLLAEPPRDANNYKRYGVEHLVRVLRIKRLSDLGLSLARIEALGEAPEDRAAALAELDAELSATIERLHRIRARVEQLSESSSPTELPPQLGAAAAAAVADMTVTDRALVAVVTQSMAPEALADYDALLSSHRMTAADRAFDELPPDADDAARADLAEQLAVRIGEVRRAYPRSAQWALPREALRTALLVYNEAQRDVLRRAVQLAAG